MIPDSPPAATGVPGLDSLLRAGPFHQALRAAIAARGLPLDRIRSRLADYDTPVSVATLSYWQSGRRQPERDASRAALANVEKILGLPPRALVNLLHVPAR